MIAIRRPQRRNAVDGPTEFTAQRDVRTLKAVAGDAEQASARFTSGGQRG